MGFDLETELHHRRRSGLYRTRKHLTTPQSPDVRVDGQACIAFCSNDYLGLANHPEIVATFQKAAKTYGVGGGASHLIVGHSHSHHQLEEELADFTGRDRALVFSTGYMANIGVMSALLGKKDAVFQDRLNHASLLDAGLLSGARFQRYLHGNTDNLKKRLIKTDVRRKLIVTDGVFSMDGDVAPVDALCKTARQHDAWLMLDDAHGFGCLGKQGGGLAEVHRLSQKDLPVLVGTLGKAFGTSGAFVAGSEALIETLIQFARSYIYTTASPPAVAEATRTSLRLVRDEGWRREHLNQLVTYFRTECLRMGLPIMPSSSPIQPILAGSTDKALRISQLLLGQGFLITAIRPPTVPEGSSRLRITLSAAHQQEHVDQLLEALDRIKTLFRESICQENTAQEGII